MCVVRLEMIESISTFISVVLVYVVVTTCSGYFRAWIAHKVGDDTPAALGFLTLDPLQHLDIFGALFFNLIGFGWGKTCPLNGLVLLHKKYPWARIALANYADVIALFILSFLMLIVQIYIVGLSGLPLIVQGLVSLRSASPNVFFIWWPALSTWAGTVGHIAMLISRLATVLGSIYFLLRSFEVAELVFPKFGAFLASMPIWGRMILMFIVLSIGSSFIYYYMIQALVFLSSSVAALIIG